jgi:D-inositol-3-phosphate glycosyltransferase
MGSMNQTAAARIAVISLHTSPLDQPGTGDSGGMNVEIRAVAERLGDRGIATDIFTRCAGRPRPEVESVDPMTRLIQVQAGPCAEVDKLELPSLVPDFSEGILRRGAELGPYDLVHAHYWLSGPAGVTAARRWDVPLVASFHTLAEVKNRAFGDRREPASRVEGERRAIEAAHRVVVPTREDAGALVGLYGADAARVRVVPPGVDRSVIHPRDRGIARARLDLAGGPVVLFVGRLQELKGPDLAIRAFAEAVRGAPDLMRAATLLVVGGPSGAPGAESWLPDVASAEGVLDRVRFLPPVPHEDLSWVYSAADVLLMPSRSESFGLAALEAQACGVPVVASGVGGLRTAVHHGVSGYLVDGRDPGAYASRVLAILESPRMAERLARGAIAHAARFPWDATVDSLLGLYAELLPVLEPAAAS